MNNQTSSMNVISGVPTRVGAPVEDIVKVNTALSQRYWQNQQQQTQLNNAVKNMPIIDKSVDSGILVDVSNKINESFKSVIENDNWEDATSTVAKTANMVANDDRLKALQSNVALIKQSDSQWEERLKNDKNGTLRMAKPIYDAMTREAYIKQGGSVTKDGLPQQIRTFSPSTNLDISDEIEKIATIAKSMKATVTTSFGNREYISKADLDRLPDGDVKDVLANQMKSETKIKTSSLSESRLKQMASDYLRTDADYALKLMEISQVEKYRLTGTTLANENDLKELARIGASPREREIAISLTPAYTELINKFNGDKNNPEFIRAYNNLYKNEAVYKNGQDLMYKLPQNQQTELYYKFVNDKKHREVIDTVGAYKEYQQDIDKHYFETHYMDALSKATEANVSSYTGSDIGSGTIKLSTDLTNPNKDIYKQFKVLEAAYLANPKNLSDSQVKQYLELKSTADALGQTARGIWNSSTPEERDKFLSKAWALWGSDAHSTFGNVSKLTKADLIRTIKNAENVNDLRPSNAGGTLNPKMIEHRANLIGDYVLTNMKPQDIFLSNSEIYDKFSKDINLSKEGKAKLFQRLDRQRLNLYSSIQRNVPDKFVVPTTVMTHIGKTSALDMQLNKNIVQSLVANQLVDVETGKTFNPEEYGIDMEKIKSSINNDDLNLSGFDIGIVSFNGSKNGGNYYRITYPIAKKTSDKNQTVGTTGSVVIRYDGNDALTNAHKLEAMNALRSQLNHSEQVDYRTGKVKLNSDVTYPQFQKVRQDGNTLARTYAEGVRTTKGLDIYDVANSLDANGRNSSIKSVFEVDAGGTTYQYQVNSAKNGYNVDIIRKSDGVRLPTKRITDIRDLATFVGLQKAKGEGLDSKVYESLMSAFTPDEYLK